jgi:NADH:ubiquinone oxidoreductase subunit E
MQMLQNFTLVNYYIYVYQYTSMYESQREIARVCSFLLCEVQGSNSVHYAWQQALYLLSQPTSP